MSITHRAYAESERYSYEAFGHSEESARAALLMGLHEHAGQMRTDAGWPEEVLATASVHAVQAGVSLYHRTRPAGPAHELATEDSTSAVAFRAASESGFRDHGFGWVDGYGATEEEARRICTRGLATIHGASPATLAMYVDEIHVYPVEEGAAYRGGLVGNVGERLA